MNQDNNPGAVKIGELLIGVGALSSGDLTEAIQISKRMGVPIGRVLVMSGCVSEANLQQALEVQSLVRDGLCDVELGQNALSLVFNNKIPLQDALKSLNWTPKTDSAGNKLGDLLVDSNIVSRGQLDRALETSFQSGMPLGGTLVIQGVLSAQLLPTVLHIQEQIRDNKLTREGAIQTLQQALMFWAKADQSKQEELAGSMDAVAISRQRDLGTATAAQTQRPTQQPPALAQAASTQATGPATASGGTDSVDLVNTVQNLAERPPSGPSVPSNQVSLVELLKISGFCTQNSLEHAVQQSLLDSRLAAKMLVAIGFIDTTSLNNFVLCQALIAKGRIRTEQALYALNSVRHRKINLEQALTEMGISPQV